jgi:glutathione S-transferase
MLTVYALPGGWGLPSASPFVAKLETWLRMADIPYERVADPRKRGKKGKFPWVRLDSGEELCDSAHIIARLTAAHGVTLDADLDADQRARSLLLQRLLEDHLYFAVLYLRWQDPEGWDQVRPVFFRGLPPIVSSLLPGFIRNATIKSLHGQGTGRHTREEVEAAAKADLDALATLLGERDWLLGDTPHGIDATGTVFMDAILRAPSGGLTAHLEMHPNLVAYAERGRARFWPELDKPATT